MRQCRALANLAAQELIDRHTVDLADRIVQGDVDRSLRIGVATQRAVHPGVQLLDLGDVRADDGGKQDLLDCGRCHLRRLSVPRAMVAAPRADHLCFAPTHDAAFELQAKNGIAFAKACRMADPVMRPADGQSDKKNLPTTDFQAGHAHWRWSSISRSRRLQLTRAVFSFN